MKHYTLFILSVLLLAACRDGPMRSSYLPGLPELPPHWEELLGEPHWRLEWLGEEGTWQELELPPGREAPGLSLIQEWTSPVLAWPYWPARNLLPGMMRPSGALFPWDVSGGEPADLRSDLSGSAAGSAGKITLSWRGGAEAVFWKELAAADRLTGAAEGRLPWYFDWPRFRDLLYESGNIPEAVSLDPWLADWKDIGQRTVQSGFDRRRIVSRKFTELAVPGLSGCWISGSPFAEPVDAQPEGPLLLNVTDTPDTWVSGAGILKCSTAGWVLQAAR